MDKGYLREMQKKMFNCSAKCCDDRVSVLIFNLSIMKHIHDSDSFAHLFKSLMLILA